MENHPAPSRRTVLQLGGAAGLAAAVASIPRPASAAPPDHGHGPGVTITDLGPGVEQFALFSGLLVGDIVYIGSRNLDPTRVIGFDLRTKKVVSRVDLPGGYAIQAMASNAPGDRLTVGVLQDAAGPANLYQIDLTSTSPKAVAIGTTGERDVRDVAVAPDGMVYAVGGSGGNQAPALWECDPSTGTVRSLGVPDPTVTLAQAVAATDSTVYFGAGSVLSGGGAGKAVLYAFDRATGASRSILPAEVAGAISVTDLQILGSELAVGLKGPGKSLLIDLADPTKYEVIPRTGILFCESGDNVYFASNGNVYAYSLLTKKVQTAQDGTALGGTWGLAVYGGSVVSVSDAVFVAVIDIASRTVTKTNLEAAGAEPGPQLAMGVVAGAGYAYVGGNGVMSRRSWETGAVVNLGMPGEAKDAVVVDGVLYTGQYNNQGVWSYDPAGAGPHQVATFPSGQNRPLDVCWDAVNRLVLVGAQSDTNGGGCFAAYDITAGAVRTWVNPIDDRQMVRAVATREGVAFLGGDNIYANGPRSTVVAFDPVAGKELWRVDPQQPSGIAALAVQGRYLYGMSRGAAGVFVLDVTTRRIVKVVDVRGICTDFGALVTNRGVVYGVSDTTVFRFDPKTFAVSVVVPEINGGWYSGSHIAADDLGRLYTMRGRNLVRIEDPTCRGGYRGRTVTVKGT
ncbi:PQQ-binding-like beta-propeller repeat protein [Luteipulveratus mongoliensis]|uniref:Uncharacterized protein n=1 Tax=Luteipulveratus mongoliensis TaxID=571913 RepID=A0A0K1JK52_9MICO|nr:PQQ-binding-like beta-propeller repeat protein [Luteipulveratus mongoliensis]AKU17104.1 hypothetical protein VV02_16610 [Luteipulveratus mongoliensis]